MNEEAAMTARLLRLIIAVLLCAIPLGALAQTPQAAPTQALLKPAELDQLLAPIALYSDPLLSEVLIASTYPLEVVQADRWAKSNTTLKGNPLAAALAKQSWDDSVKALAQVPTVLAMMADQLDWTQHDQRADRHGQDRGSEAVHHNRAELPHRDLRAVLRARCGLWRMALS
jgi:hypothetical protein